MSDLISRQAAIAYAISGRIRALPTTEDGEDWIRVSEVRESLIAVPSAPRWIPCEERLPKPVAPSQRREWFITSNTYGGVTVTCYEFEASPFKEGWQTDMTILAWMPLPEPYKE